MACLLQNFLIHQFHDLQGKNVSQRCKEAERILKTCSLKELRQVLPALLQCIFGLHGQPGWGINTLCRSQHSSDFDALRLFLALDGPLLDSVYSLEADTYAVYNFPFADLPAPSRCAIHEGLLPEFYKDKTHSLGYGFASVSITVFELYFFYFARALVSAEWQAHHTGSAWTSRLFDWVYPTLLDDYLNHFLPLDKHELPCRRSPLRSPLQSTVVRRSPSTYSRQCILPPSQHSYCSDPNRSLLMSQLDCSSQHSVAFPSGCSGVDPGTQRSETVLQIFVEFWLNQNYPISTGPSFDAHTFITEHFMPSVNHVLVVRLLVKYLHYFTSSTTCLPPSSYHNQAESALLHFKRLACPLIVREKLYQFLFHLFDRWPLDCHFRMVLETWLSYIQPWRYTDCRLYWTARDGHLHHDADARERAIGVQWNGFLEDNIAFYTTLFIQLISRLERMDLSSPHTAYLLYRVAKVFNSQNLPAALASAEGELYSQGALCASPTTAQSSAPYSCTLPGMESANLEYFPLFCEESLVKVKMLIKRTMCAYNVVKTKAGTPNSGSVWSQVCSLFSDGGQYGDNRHLTLLHLDLSTKALASIFGFQPSSRQEDWAEVSEGGDVAMADEDALPECQDTPYGPQLTRRGRLQICAEELSNYYFSDNRHQRQNVVQSDLNTMIKIYVVMSATKQLVSDIRVMNNVRKFPEGQLADPDLQPIRSFESVVILRILARITSHINHQCSDQILSLYHRSGFLGSLAKVFLAPPLSSDQPISPVSPATFKALCQPRLSLRHLASYRSLALLVVLYASLHVWLDLRPVGFSLLLVACTLLYGLAAAFWKTYLAV